MDTTLKIPGKGQTTSRNFVLYCRDKSYMDIPVDQGGYDLCDELSLGHWPIWDVKEITLN